MSVVANGPLVIFICAFETDLEKQKKNENDTHENYETDKIHIVSIVLIG